ncbi:hypothetical protein [Loigolactobacillus backii]|uniref:hypothetical protein n=1 Tax=Loigolactobacillus backii TaxID=375175 RepID=UPI0022FD5D81|nr:hypothetical protein [Loigolactobacillus backii]MDA5386651.1 hypothetical protein [Loigolactobacillus backii]MDA5389178.1 hypothetical protein [Loigolactobacillus backii]
MKVIYENIQDQIKILKADEDYYVRFIVWRMPIHEETVPIEKQAVDAYLQGQHTADELLYYADFGIWKPDKSPIQTNRDFLEKFPEFVLIAPENAQKIFSKAEYKKLVKRAHGSAPVKRTIK